MCTIYRKALLPPRYFMKVNFKKKNSHSKIAAAFVLVLFHPSQVSRRPLVPPLCRLHFKKSQYLKSSNKTIHKKIYENR